MSLLADMVIVLFSLEPHQRPVFEFRARLDVGSSSADVKGGSKQWLELSGVFRIAFKAALQAFARAYPLVTIVKDIV